MKNSSLKVLLAAATLFVGTQMFVNADSTTPAAPGTSAATDTKTQLNNPSGPSSQTANAPDPTTKKDGTTACPAPGAQTTASGDAATKTPQKDAPKQ